MYSEQEKYSAHVLELVRNNGISAEKADGISKAGSQAEKNTNRFFMFDYFDVLLYRKLCGTDKNYLNYFAINDTFDDDKDYKVSFKTLSLYNDLNDEGANPFLYMKQDGLTEIPFLGLIQISLCNEIFLTEKDSQYEIEQFLSDCEAMILKLADQGVGEEQNPRLIRQLFRSSTTGDFCLAVRTDSVEKIYNIALMLNNSQSDPNTMWKFLTYTNVGIECCVLENGSYATLSEQFVKEHGQMTFALRFSADFKLLSILKNYQKSQNNIKLEIYKGLFGRYDYLLHMDVKQFTEIYPVLCEKKLGLSKRTGEAYIDGKIDLKNILRYSHIRNINERVLADLSGSEGAGKELEGSPEKNGYLEEVLQENKTLFAKIMKLKDWVGYFSEEERAFKDLFRSMQQIYKTYSAIGMERESYINWKMFCQDITVLCDSINYCMTSYVGSNEEEWSEEQRVRFCSRLLKDWRMSIQAVNQYTRLVQNINYQTYQSPVYELHTQIDTEKVIVAYREAMDSFINLFVEGDRDGTDDCVKIIPLVYPDISKDKVEVTAPFVIGNRREQAEKRGIICSVPSFEYFGRLYDLLPWILHESSHHIRILGRKERNEFLVEYIFSYVFRIVLEMALPKMSNSIWRVELGKAEQNLLDCMLEIVKVKLNEISEFDRFGFEKVILEVDKYLAKLFPFGAGNVSSRFLYEPEEVGEKIFEFYLNEYREEGILDGKNLERILEIKKGNIFQERLVGDLLDRYFKRIFGEASDVAKKCQPIQLVNFCQRRERFEKELLKILKKISEKKASEDAVKEYCYKVLELYRIFHMRDIIELVDPKSEEEKKNFLTEVFYKYQEQYKNNFHMEEQLLLSDPSTMYILRNYGLLSNDVNVFQAKMLEVFRDVDCGEIKQYKEDRVKVYREAFADLMMATSLELNSFGYCRQVFQTISDTGSDEKCYRQDDTNDCRFRIVTAVLLEKELSKMPETERDERIHREEEIIRLNGKSIIEKAEIYCEYTLKCICQKLLEREEIAESDVKKEQVEFFLGDMKRQIQSYLKNIGEEGSYSRTLLCILLHGENKADKSIMKIWREYGEITEFCKPIKYLFWRLECFCLGLERIMPGGNIIIETNVFEHMKRIREKISKRIAAKRQDQNKSWEYLYQPMRDVTMFYNTPEQVFEKKTQWKLETTIAFVQNYYYYNRFKMMGNREES